MPIAPSDNAQPFIARTYRPTPHIVILSNAKDLLLPLPLLLPFRLSSFAEGGVSASALALAFRLSFLREAEDLLPAPTTSPTHTDTTRPYIIKAAVYNAMPVATLTLEFAIEHAHSLKDRRQVVRSLKDKLRHGFNISISELDEAVVYNRVTLGVAAISSSSAYLAGQLREVEDAARRLAAGLSCDLIDSYIEPDVL